MVRESTLTPLRFEELRLDFFMAVRAAFKVVAFIEPMVYVTLRAMALHISFKIEPVAYTIIKGN
jgi:hypothetical protein